MASSDTTPAKGTSLAALVVDHVAPYERAVYIYYQNCEGKLCKLIRGGKAELIDAHRPLKHHSPLASVKFSPPPTKIAPYPEVFGKNPEDKIVAVTALHDHVCINTEPGSKFGALTTNQVDVYFHFQPVENKHEIVEKKRRHPPSDPIVYHTVAKNAAFPPQPLAACAGTTSFWPPHLLEAVKAQALARNLGPLQVGRERWTTYHGDDQHLWFSYTFDFHPGGTAISLPEKVTSVDDIWVDPRGFRSPLALVQVDRRPAIYYLNSKGAIYRTIKTDGHWEQPKQVVESGRSRDGTNLAAVADFQLWSDLLHYTVCVAYQDHSGNIQTAVDKIVFHSK